MLVLIPKLYSNESKLTLLQNNLMNPNRFDLNDYVDALFVVQRKDEADEKEFERLGNS